MLMLSVVKANRSLTAFETLSMMSAVYLFAARASFYRGAA